MKNNYPCYIIHKRITWLATADISQIIDSNGKIIGDNSGINENNEDYRKYNIDRRKQVRRDYLHGSSRGKGATNEQGRSPGDYLQWDPGRTARLSDKSLVIKADQVGRLDWNSISEIIGHADLCPVSNLDSCAGIVYVCVSVGTFACVPHMCQIICCIYNANTAGRNYARFPNGKSKTRLPSHRCTIIMCLRTKGLIRLSCGQ